VFQKHAMNYFLYADDIQIIAPSKLNELNTVLQKVEACVIDVRSWLANIQLCLNHTKTEVIVLGSRQLLKRCNSQYATICDHRVQLSSVVRDLGFFVDATLLFDSHISRITSAAFSHLHIIGRLRHVLSVSHSLLLINALVLSRLHFCSSLLNGISSIQYNRLQRILNFSMRVALRLRKSDSVSAHMITHGWLKIKQLVFLRTASLIYTVLRTGRPTYLASLLHQYTPARHLR
jgi:hypothetical protein